MRELVFALEFKSGSITYGAAGKVTFKTVGPGLLGPFRGAQGLITPNFTVGAVGEVTDDHFARLYLPS